ncbi:HK97 family phage prohead protease [Rhodovulum sulfidophilum]|nr:HK97 family phage prohead protease [Rhodovulum sulfidophilum]
MLLGATLGALELRSEGGTTRLRACFPYGAETELAAGRREIIAPRAFADRIERGEDIHLLAGHSYDRPLASRASGSLTLRDSDEGVELVAEIDPGTSWARDFLAAHAAGLIRGLSPGFRVQPGGERIERRGADLVRTVTSAAVFEFSAVTRPAYQQAQIEARNWQPVGEVIRRVLDRPAACRWR